MPLPAVRGGQSGAGALLLRVRVLRKVVTLLFTDGATALFERKGCVVCAARTRARLI